MRSKIFILFLGVIFASVAEPEEPEIKGYLYPLFNGLSVNVNILDGITNLF